MAHAAVCRAAGKSAACPGTGTLAAGLRMLYRRAGQAYNLALHIDFAYLFENTSICIVRRECHDILTRIKHRFSATSFIAR